MLRRETILLCAVLPLVSTATVAADSGAPAPAVNHALDIYAEPAQRVDIGRGRKMNLRCSGTGEPTVVLDIGTGMTSMSWRKVQPLIAAKQRVCSYDRAGFGFSDPGPLPRSAKVEADDLHALVHAAGLHTPLVLVGHSRASYIVRLYASAHPEDVAGLVLVDPVSETLDDDAPGYARHEASALAENTAYARKCQAAAKSGELEKDGPATKACVPPPFPTLSEKLGNVVRDRFRHVEYWDASISEHETDAADIAAVKASHIPADLPLIVLSAGGGRDWVAPEDRKIVDAAFSAGHARIAALSSRGRVIPVPDASHNMQEDRPDAIADAVAKIDAEIADARRGH